MGWIGDYICAGLGRDSQKFLNAIVMYSYLHFWKKLNKIFSKEENDYGQKNREER